MIECLEDIPALTRSWIAALARADPALHAELAESIVVGAPGHRSDVPFPAGVAAVLAALDLGGKEIGAFRFAPMGGGAASAQIHAYDRAVRLHYDAPAGLVFIGEYGADSLFAAPHGIGLFDAVHARTAVLAPDFTQFLLVQANAYDAYKRHIVKAGDKASYDAVCTRLTAHPRFAGTDVAAIFDAQLKA